MNKLAFLALAAVLAADFSFAQTVDEVGDDTNVFNGFTASGRGNRFTVSTDVTLTEIESSVGLSSSQETRFVVKRRTGAGTNDWVIELEEIIAAQGPGHPPFWSSGPLSFNLVSGEEYAIMMYWSGTGDYYNDSSATVFGPVSFGDHVDNAYENSYPPSTFTGSVSGSWIPHQRLTTTSASVSAPASSVMGLGILAACFGLLFVFVRTRS